VEDRLPAIGGALRTAARRWGTPLYVTDLATIDAAAEEVRAAFPDPWIRQYSLKSNDLPAIVTRIARHGFGANVVSRGEWSLATRAGVPGHRVTMEGIGKTDADLRAVVRAAASGTALHWIAIESADEAAALAAFATRAGLGHDHPTAAHDGPGAAAAPRAGEDIHAHAHAHHEEHRDRRHRVARLDVLLRLNPAVRPETFHGLAVGAAGSKFGLADDEIAAALEAGGGPGGPLRWRGIHLHVGSQLGAVDAWRDAIRRALALVALMRGTLPHFDTLDVGGGFPVAIDGRDDSLPGPARFAAEIPALIEAIPHDRRPARLAVEPGRFLVARAGWLVARVLHVRPDRGEQGAPMVVLDAGMTELIRPALYGAHHRIVALSSLGRPLDPGAPSPMHMATSVEGPVCESTDAFGVERLPPLRRGDIVAIRDAGAYAASLSSRYNGRPRPPEVLLDPDGGLSLARRRGSLDSLA
jgi:diaminopimelate decarboxylase